MNDQNAMEMLTPEGRWSLLQQWIEENPKRKKLISKWIEASPEAVFPEIRDVLSDIAMKKFGLIAASIVRLTPYSDDIRSMIVTMQSMYKERANNEHMERKDARRSKRKR